MTNKIEISRELAERLTKDYTGRPNWDALEEDRLAATEELRALLAAPAVERQPVAYVLTRDDDVCYEADDGIVISNTPGDETSLYKWKPVYFDTSLPAPVAVVLPDDTVQNAKRYEWIRSQNIGHCEINRVLFETISDDCNPPYRSLKYGSDLDTAIDACLDKVKELNQ